jgi:hypothetical protein
MSKKQEETRIVTRAKGQGKTEVMVHCPESGRTIATGLETVNEQHLDKEIRNLKETLERAGNRVSVVQQGQKG